MSADNRLRLGLSFGSPPISANQRLHWAQKAKIVKQVRHESAMRARSAGWGPQQHITIHLTYQPRDNRRRDPSNLMPTQKALVDGLVDAGIVPDDTPEYVTETIPSILPAEKGAGGAMWLDIEATGKETA